MMYLGQLRSHVPQPVQSAGSTTGRPCVAHGNGVERAYLGAGSKTHTADFADLGSAGHGHRRAAVADSLVFELQISLGAAIGAVHLGHLGLAVDNRHTHDRRHRFGHGRAAGHADVDLRFAGSYGLGRLAATGEPASAAVGSRQVPPPPPRLSGRFQRRISWPQLQDPQPLRNPKPPMANASISMRL